MTNRTFENPFGPYKNKHVDTSAVFFGSGPTILEEQVVGKHHQVTILNLQ